MQFIDEAKIFVRSGPGGDGCVSFRREANIPKGGPDGGNGGRGGHIILRSVPGLNTLIDYRYAQHFKATRGGHGMGRDRYGKAAEDIYLDLPVGTEIVDDETGDVIIDMTEEGQEIILLRGGEGGFGNAQFKTSVNQAPRKFTPGGESHEMWIRLRLKLLCDVGLIGLPNAGKSTFLSAVSRARPKIADYPFTTLKPQLGVVYHHERECVVADLPGLIEGAHQGVGLGIRFLKHAQRCRVLLHLIDATQEDPISPYHVIRKELESYDSTVAALPQIVAITKIDALPKEDVEACIELLEESSGCKILTLSSVSGQGKDEVLTQVFDILEKIDRPFSTESDMVLKIDSELEQENKASIHKGNDGDGLSEE